MPGDSGLGPYYLWKPPQTFPYHIKANILAGVAFVVLIMIARCASATAIVRELWKHKVYYSQVLKGTQHTQGHTVRSQHTQGHTSGQSSRAFKRGVSWMGWPGSLSSCVAGSMFIWDACLWNGHLANQKVHVRYLYCIFSRFCCFSFFAEVPSRLLIL